MPRGRRSRSFNDAQEILQQLINEGRVSAADVDRYRQIGELERQLASLRGGGKVGRRRGRPPAAAGRRGRKAGAAALTAGQRASRQLQGRYLALVRQIPATRRRRFSEMVQKQGREAAIRAMQAEVGGAKASAGRGRPARRGAAGKRRRRSAKLTSEQIASRKLQGRYLGLIRQIPATQRGKYKKIVKDRGREAAIKELQSAVGK